MQIHFASFRRSLLDWFKQNRRILPWRENPSLYKTVISEFMLQQTRVDTVIPYFLNWLEKFPDFETLAHAQESTVLKAWEGLGYYNRARNLHRLAREITAAGGPPQRFEDWRALPGIGPYTAAAIGSIALKIPTPVVDGNVIRVLSRLKADSTQFTSLDTARRHFEESAGQLLDPHNPGSFNEALMELGATVCTKHKPLCLLCPVRDHCQSANSPRAASLPNLKRASQTKRVIDRLLSIQNNQILLVTYPPNSRRLAGVSELPPLPPELKKDTRLVLIRRRGISNEQIEERIHSLEDAAAIKILPPCASWHPLPLAAEISLSGPHRRWLKTLLQTL